MSEPIVAVCGAWAVLHNKRHVCTREPYHAGKHRSSRGVEWQALPRQSSGGSK